MKSLKTERLIFRPYIKCEADRTAVVKLLTEEEVMNQGDGVITKEQAEESFNRIFTDVYKLSAFDIWGVFLRENSEYVGQAEIKPRKGTQHWEIVYILNREHLGRGYATEITQALVEYGFQTRKLKRVLAAAKIEDKDSICVFEEVGMTLYKKETDQQSECLIYAISSI